MKYSIIVPVFNRPDEVDELLESLTHQSEKDFEVVIVEDGSQTPCEEVCKRYEHMMDIHYYYKENSGPGQSRNYGAKRAKGEYLLILDSDVVLPEGYLKAVSDELSREPADAFGGPDKAHSSFTDTQKAISYSMTSFFTTGGIRGGKKKMDKFYPRSFNMGIRRDVYLRLNGFSNMRFGEDIDFSIRIFKAGCRCRLFPEAWVWHKRRTDFRKFWRQVYNSGIARIKPLQEISREPQARASPPYGLHRGCNRHTASALLRLPAIHAWHRSRIPNLGQCDGSIGLHRSRRHHSLYHRTVYRQHQCDVILCTIYQYRARISLTCCKSIRL